MRAEFFFWLTGMLAIFLAAGQIGDPDSRAEQQQNRKDEKAAEGS